MESKLVTAIISGNDDYVERFLANPQPLDMSHRFMSGSTLLHHAARHSVALTRWFLLHIPVDVVDRFNETPLHYAIDSRQQEVIRLLISLLPPSKLNDDEYRKSILAKCDHYFFSFSEEIRELFPQILNLNKGINLFHYHSVYKTFVAINRSGAHDFLGQLVGPTGVKRSPRMFPVEIKCPFNARAAGRRAKPNKMFYRSVVERVMTDGYLRSLIHIRSPSNRLKSYWSPGRVAVDLGCKQFMRKAFEMRSDQARKIMERSIADVNYNVNSISCPMTLKFDLRQSSNGFAIYDDDEPIAFDHIKQFTGGDVFEPPRRPLHEHEPLNLGRVHRRQLPMFDADDKPVTHGYITSLDID